MYRYFIDIQDAALLAIKLLQEMKGGEVFVPKMQEYSMLEILKEKYPDCEIKEIGKGQGERLHEPLFAEGEVPIDKGDYYVV
jgi:FlaA1/EpsC-like NDP-sugar epimerase